MEEFQKSFPFLFPHQMNFTEEQALDWELERFYNLCIFQKPTTSKSTTLNSQDATTINGRQNTIKSLNQIEIGREFFGKFVEAFSVQHLVDWFCRLYFRLPVYLHLHEANNLSRNFNRQGLQFQQFFFQSFLLYIKIAREDERNRVRTTGEKGIRVCDEPTDSQFNFKDAEKEVLLKLIIRTDFPMTSKIWTLISAANVSIIHKNSNFPTLVKQAAELGEVSFWALNYAILRFGPEFNVSILANLLLLNERVLGRMVEEFLADRSEEERATARQIIVIASSQWTTNINVYREAVLRICRRSDASISAFERFRENMTDLMTELRREPPRSNLISMSWARKAVKIYMEKHFVKKEIPVEQLYDLAYTILKQRPQLRSDIVQQFRRYQDPISAEYWNNFFVDVRINQFQAAILQPKKNNPPKMVYRLIDANMHEVRDEFLSIPPGVEVYIVDKVPKLAVIEHHLRQCSNSDYAIIGLDAEWSPYVMSSRASILQIAFHSVVFILDLDSIDNNQNELTRFVDRLFKNPKIIKIGFQFSEDLLQLRKKIPNCMALYDNSVNLIDILKVVTQLVLLSKKADVSFEEYLKFAPEELVEDEESALPQPETEDSLNEAKMNESVAEKMDESVEGEANLTVKAAEDGENGEESGKDAGAKPSDEKEKVPLSKEEKKLRHMGLSTLCQLMLGKPLDKSEQCSQWARRPLRKLQIRYAALDSFSILMLYDQCVLWAKKLGLKIVDITAAQERISAPLPLFFDRTKLESSEPSPSA